MLKRHPRSEAQKTASRANGRKSTGTPHAPRAILPNAPIPFDVPATNRLSKLVLLEGESPIIFLNLARQLHDELGPQSNIELILVAKILLAYWRQMRAWTLERDTITQAAGSHLCPASQPVGAPANASTNGIEALGVTGRFVLSEYEARFDRQFTRTLAAFARYRKSQPPKEANLVAATLGTASKQSNSHENNPEKPPENPGA